MNGANSSPTPLSYEMVEQLHHRNERTQCGIKPHEHTESYSPTCWQPFSLPAMCSWTGGPSLRTICSLQPVYSSWTKVIPINRDIHPETRQSQNTLTLVSSKLSNIRKSPGIHTQNRMVFLGDIWTFVALELKPNNLKHFSPTQIWTSCVYLKHGWQHHRLSRPSQCLATMFLEKTEIKEGAVDCSCTWKTTLNVNRLTWHAQMTWNVLSELSPCLSKCNLMLLVYIDHPHLTLCFINIS